MEAARACLKVFIKKVAGEVVQFSMALVKSHLPEADLDPVGEGVTPDCIVDEWKVYFNSPSLLPTASSP
jgi:hypothetical protein